jgi:monoamine oxidase
MKINIKINYKLLLTLFICVINLGCFNWAARATKYLPKETALHKSYDYDGKVIIVGAGASGLAAAKVLEKNNISYIILEATDRYGGRLKQDTSLADFPIDIGAEWIHSAPITLNILKGEKSSIIKEDLIPYHLGSTATWDGKNLSYSSKWFNDFMYNFMPESKFKKSTWYEFIDTNIANDVKHKIKFNSVVDSINYSKDMVVVSTKDGATYRANKVLLTVSIGVLKSGKIQFFPKMNKKKIQAIESITFNPGFKAVMKFSEKFYPDAINCKVKNGEKVYYDIAFKKESNNYILGFLYTGTKVDNYYQLGSEKHIISSLIDELDEMFDGKASKFYTDEFLFENWGKHDFTLGTWTQAFLEKNAHLNILREPLKNKVYFAGEIYDRFRQMGVPGAILSGYDSIDELLTDN